jgi:hypothetical protein
MPEPTIVNKIFVAPLEGVTTAIVLFVFACLAWPHLIKNRTQYYVAVWCAVGIILLNTLSLMLQSPTANVVFAVFIGVLQIIAVLMLVLCAGGLTMKSMAGEMGRAYEVIRRGEEEKEVIIPLTGQKPKAGVDDDDDGETPVIHINTPPPTPPPSAPPPPGAEDKSSIPLE